MTQQTASTAALCCPLPEQWIEIRAYPSGSGLSIYMKLCRAPAENEPTIAMSNSLLQAIMNGATDAILVKDRKHRYTMVNTAAAQSVGKSVEEVIGTSPEDLFSPATAREIVESDHEVMSSRKPQNFEFTECISGVSHTYAVTKIPYFDDEGRVVGLIEICNDITEQKQAEARLVQLEEANRELETFSYAVSHDLRAPLAVISGFAHTTLHFYSSGLNEDGRAQLQRIVTASEHMNRLIDALLNLSQVGQTEMYREAVDWTAMAWTLAKELERLYPERVVDVAVHDGMMVNADPRLMGAVMDNLVRNAWKFTSKRDTASIEVGILRQDGGDVYFVRDNGVGFDSASADRLFTPFQRLHSDQEFEGFGVGLSTVKRIIVAHGGGIWAESQVDQGATFYFTL